MNKTFEEAQALASEVVNMVKDEANNEAQVVLCPSFPFLPVISKAVAGSSNIHVGAQNCHQQESGAYTGEVSAPMLQSIGVTYVILGHSERRQYFQEDNQLLEAKVKAVLKQGLHPIFCIGESLEQREQDLTFSVLETQLKEGLFHVSNEDFERVVIAYEPIWAIGTGKTASSQQAQEVHAFIREQIARAYDAAAAQNTTILYGGSCNPANARELFACPDIDGGLIGGASLKSRDFVDIVKAMKPSMS